MISRSSAHLSRNRYSYCFRIKIPRDLHRHFGKKELRYSLKTGYLGLAKSRSRLLAGLTQKLFTYLRGAGCNMKLSETELSDIIENFKAVALENYLSNRLAEAENTSDIATVFGDLLSQVSAVKIGMIGGGFPWVSDALDDVLAGMQYDLDRDSVQYRELCKQLSQITIDHMKREKVRLQGKYPELELNRMFQEQLEGAGTQTDAEIPITPGIALSELIDLYEKENVRAGNWQVRTVPEY